MRTAVKAGLDMKPGACDESFIGIFQAADHHFQEGVGKARLDPARGMTQRYALYFNHRHLRDSRDRCRANQLVVIEIGHFAKAFGGTHFVDFDALLGNLGLATDDDEQTPPGCVFLDNGFPGILLSPVADADRFP